LSRGPHAFQVTLNNSSNGSEFSPGKIAILSRSGTLCYETVGSTTKAGLGQSTVIGIGGDRTPGTTYLDALQFLAQDAQTKGAVWFLECIDVRDHFDRGSRGRGRVCCTGIYQRNRLGQGKVCPISLLANGIPILSYFAGLCALKGYTMGHSGNSQWSHLTAGAIKDSVGSQDDAGSKIRAYRKEGIKVLDHIGYIGEEMKSLMSKYGH
jgi:succinyl-CoA synthetase alpha subunit